MSVREVIIDDLVTTLETVTTANGYDFDLTVVNFPTHFKEVDVSSLPIASIYRGSTENKIFEGDSVVDFDWQVGLRVYIEAASDGTHTMEEQADRMVDNLHKCIFNNHTLGNSNVIFAEVSRTERPFTWPSAGDIGDFDLILNIKYRRNF